MSHSQQDIKQFIREHASDDVRQLALRARSYPDIDMRFAIQQIAGRQIAKNKIPSWYDNDAIIYPKHLSLEQCSSEKTALYKARLCQGKTLTDLTGGLGVDFYFMSRHMEKTVYVEAQTELTELATHNFASLELHCADVVNNDAVNYLQDIETTQDIIYIDPARRNETGSKTVLIEDCVPNLLAIDDLLNEKAKRTIIKLSPMLDITLALQSLSNITEVHIVSIANECKELLFIKDSAAQKAVAIHCVNILNNGEEESFSFTHNEEESAITHFAQTVQQYLYEPNSSIMKAGAYKSIAAKYGLNKLHPNSHLYTSDTFVRDFPGRKFVVKNVISPNKKDIKSSLGQLKQANISTRNYPFSVAEIRKQTKLKEGGKDYIFATTLMNEKKVLILCEKADL